MSGKSAHTASRPSPSGAEKLSRDSDFHGWLLRQAKVLRGRSHKHLDWADLAEELQAMAGREERGLESQFERLLTHLLKWAYQPAHRGGGWQASIDNARDKIEERLEHSPSLAPKLSKLIETAYRRARRTGRRRNGIGQIAMGASFSRILSMGNGASPRRFIHARARCTHQGT